MRIVETLLEKHLMNRKLPVAAAFVTLFTATSALAWWGDDDKNSSEKHEGRYEHRECGKKRQTWLERRTRAQGNESIHET